MDYTFNEQSRLVRQIFKQTYGIDLTDLQLHYIDTVYHLERQVKIYDVDIFRTWGTMVCFFSACVWRALRAWPIRIKKSNLAAFGCKSRHF